MDNLSGFAWMKDTEGRYLFVNKRLEQLSPYQIGWLGKTDADLWPDEMAAIFRGTDQKVIATSKPLEIVESYMVDGEPRYAWVSKFPIFDGAGAVVMVGGSSADITKPIYAEEQLRQSESQLAEAQRLASVGSWNWDIRNNTHTWSDELYHMYGLHPQESDPSYETFIELVHPDDRAVISGAFEHAFKTQEPINAYLRIIRPDGAERIIHSRGNTVCDISGTPIRMHGTVQDVTERKQAEEALREAERKYRDIFENAGEGIFQSTPDGRYIAANPTLVRMYGFASPEELIQSRQDISRQVYVDPTRRDEFKRRLEAQGAVRGFEHQLFRKDGSKIWTSVNARAVRDEQGAIQYYEGTAQDVTQRKLVEKELGRSEEMYRGLVEQAPDAIFIASPNLHFIDLNARACELGGYTKDEILQMSIPDFMPPEDILSNPLRLKELQEGKTVVAERRLRRKDGTLVPVEVSTKILSDGRLQAIVRDITERKKAEAALQESEERFRQLSEAAFEAIILHDNGTILEVNRSFCRMYGYERAEVIGKSVLDLALPEFRELLLQRVRSGDTNSYEGPALRKDGTTFRTEVAGKPINYQGRVVRVAAIRDITEQKRNERRQAAQYAVTRVLAESATLAEATPQLLQVICESLRWKMGECWRVCDSTNLLRCAETWHVPTLDATSFIEASRQTELAPGVGLPGRVWQSGQPEWIPDVMTDPRFARAAIAAKVGLRGAVAFPILMGNHTLGVMQFFSRRAPEVDEDLLKIMAAIGSQIGQFTERKRAEEALLVSERKYRDIFAFAPVGIYQSLRDGTIITANHTLAEMLGYASVDELLRVKLGRALYLVDGERERLIREHEVRGYPVDLELHWKTKDGSPIWVQLTAHAIKGANGATEYWEGFVRDITELKRAEGALRQTEQQYESLVHSIDGIVWEVDPQTFRFTFVSKEAERLLGYPLAQWLNEPNFWADHTHPDDRKWAVDFCLKATATKENHQFEYRMIAVDGRVVWLKDNVTVSVMDDKSVRLRGVMMDITERKRAEEKLQNSEKYFRSLIENASDLITIADGNGIIHYESPSLERMLGYKPEERIGRSVLDLVHPDDLPAAKRHFAQGIRNPGIVHLMECRFQHKGGSWHLLETRGINLLDDPVVAGIVVNSRDITERKLAEEALRQAEQKYRRIFENASEGIFQSTPDGRFIAANPALARMHGFASPEELIRSRQDISRQIYVDPTRHEEFKRQLKEQGAVRGFEYQVFRKDGSNIWFSVNARAVRDEQGAIQYYEGTAQDMTDRKRAEEALRESEERYRELFENAKDATYVHDLNGKYTSVNRAAEKLTGYTRAEILGKEFTHFFPPAQIERIREHFYRKLVGEEEISYESEVITKDGRRVAVEVSSHVILENGVPVGVQGAARDITERKAAEEKLKANSEQLRALSARLQSAREEEGTRIARELHDELGSTLTGLRWGHEELDGILSSAKTMIDIDKLRQKIGSMTTLIDSTLDTVRRISSELRPSILDDVGLTAAVRWQTQQFEARTGIACNFSSPVEAADLSLEQSTAVFRIFQEALTNIARHAQATEVEISIKEEAEQFALTVGDNGRGINANEQSGAGSLGLLGMRERAHLVGGEVSINGSEGRGTVVTVRIPVGHPTVRRMTR